MGSLAVFDFDRTVVNDDSDATIINKLREIKPPPEFDASNYDWTPYMNDIFEHAYTAGLSQDDILDAIAGMAPTEGMELLITQLAAAGWSVLVLTDANSVFVQHWLKVHGLQDCVTEVITNRGSWRHGRLYVEPCMRQIECARCPRNLCKSAALALWRARRPAPAHTVVYVGDGRNDHCPAASLDASCTVFPRRGYPLHDLLSSSPIAATVVPWDDCYTIIRQLFPQDVIRT